MEQYSFDGHRTMILNSFDDQVSSVVDHTEERVLSEMDFFAEKINGTLEGDDASSTRVNEETGDGNLLTLELRVRNILSPILIYAYICTFIFRTSLLK